MVDSCCKDTKESALPFIELRLPESLTERLLERAPSTALRDAWMLGQALLGQPCRILLVERAEDQGWTAFRSRKTAMYKEGREWWEQHCARRSSTRVC